MTQTLFLRLAEQTDGPVQWLVVDAAGRAMGLAQVGPLAQAAAFAADRRVVVLVPGVEVGLAEPQLPVRGGARLTQVVPFALEEQLAEDLEALHFAIGRRAEERPGTPVAVVRRARLEAWLAALHAARIEPQALYADHAWLPENPTQTVVLIEASRLYVRAPQSLPLVLDIEPLEAALTAAGFLSAPHGPGAQAAAPAAQSPQPQHLIVYLTEGDWTRHQATLETLRESCASLNVQLLPGGALPLLARQTGALPALDLLQGPYAPRHRFPEGWQRWRLAATLLAGLIALHLAGKGVELWRLKQAERSLDAAIEATFRAAMPGEQNALNARRRMEARLAAARASGAGGVGLLPMLSAVGRAFVQVPGAQLDALSFRNHMLDLKIGAADVGSLSRLETLVDQGGFAAELQSSQSSGSGVEGRVQVRRGGT